MSIIHGLYNAFGEAEALYHTKQHCYEFEIVYYVNKEQWGFGYREKFVKGNLQRSQPNTWMSKTIIMFTCLKNNTQTTQAAHYIYSQRILKIKRLDQ